MARSSNVGYSNSEAITLTIKRGLQVVRMCRVHPRQASTSFQAVDHGRDELPAELVLERVLRGLLLPWPTL